MPAFPQHPPEPLLNAPVQHILDEQAAAWNRGDAAAWSSAFSEDADFINIRGDVFHGREAIVQQHARILGGPFKGSHIVITLRQLSAPAPGVALIESDHEVTGFASLPPGIVATADGVLRTHMKYVAAERDGRWVLVAGQNTAVLPAISKAGPGNLPANGHP